jgi:hypothetical protein
MKRLMESLENMFAAAAFAEAGEFETARQILGGNNRPQMVDRVNRPGKELRASGPRR